MDLNKYPRLVVDEHAVRWLQFEFHRGLANNTLQAYARGLADFFVFCDTQEIEILGVKQDTIGLYINDLRQRPLPANVRRSQYKQVNGLSNSTISLRLTVVRRFYDYLEEDRIIEQNPVRRGRYVHNNPRGGKRGLIPQVRHFPWIPNGEEWEQIIQSVQRCKLRDQVLFALSYDAALRREEVCGLHISDFDFAHYLVTIRAENTKSRRARTVPYTKGSGQLLRQYLHERAQISREGVALFLSQSPRNYAQPISSAIWSKTVRRIAQEADVLQFTPHTLRHLRLTDLARAGVDVHDIATFAGHRNIDTTMQYIHLSGTDLANKIRIKLQNLDVWRLKEVIHNAN